MIKDRKEVEYIWERSKRHKELLAVRQVAIQLRDIKKASACRVAALAIQKELYEKYGVII